MCFRLVFGGALGAIVGTIGCIVYLNLSCGNTCDQLAMIILIAPFIGGALGLIVTVFYGWFTEENKRTT